MKKYIIPFLLFFVGSSVLALSFLPNTIFLEAQTKEECTSQGGNFTKWFDESYCTLPETNDFDTHNTKDLQIKTDQIGKPNTHLNEASPPITIDKTDSNMLNVTPMYHWFTEIIDWLVFWK